MSLAVIASSALAPARVSAPVQTVARWNESPAFYQDILDAQEATRLYRRERTDDGTTDYQGYLLALLSRLLTANPIPEMENVFRLLYVVIHRFTQNDNTHDIQLASMILTNLRMYLETGHYLYFSAVFNYIKYFEPAKNWGLTDRNGNLLIAIVQQHFEDIQRPQAIA